MPNWCYNDLRLGGDPDEIREYLYVVAGHVEPYDYEIEGEFDLTRVCPMPDVLRGTTDGKTDDEEKQREWDRLSDLAEAETGHRTWYSWARANWGVKWSPEVTDLYDRSVLFHSAWCPPDELIRRSSEMFPNIVFTMRSTEESQAFACVSIFRGGKRVAEFGVEPHKPPLEELSDHVANLYRSYLELFRNNEDDMGEWIQAWSDYECELLEWVEERAESMVTV